MQARIIPGDGIGKSLGYATANLDIKKRDMHLVPGVFAAKVYFEEQTYCGALVIMDDPWKVEVHLIGYNGPDMYGIELAFTPIQQVSAIETYTTQEELIKKIATDIEMVSQVCRERGM